MLKPTRRNRLLTSLKIIQATANCIVERGVDKAGVNAIADVAQVNKVLLYRYFGTWNNLIEQLFSQYLGQIANLAKQEGTVTSASYLTAYQRVLHDNPAMVMLLHWQINNQKTKLASRLLELTQESHLACVWPTDQATSALLRDGIIYQFVSGQSERTEDVSVQLA